MILHVTPLLSTTECAELCAVFDRHLPDAPETDFSGQPVLRLRQIAAACPDLIRKCWGRAEMEAQQQSSPDFRFISCRPLLFIETTIMTCMGEGGWHAPHADNCMRNPAGEWVPNHTPHRTHTAIVYLSRGFGGGRLEFPAHGVAIYPQLGAIVVFPADKDHEHAVSEVTYGKRYSLVMWLTDKPELAEKLE